MVDSLIKGVILRLKTLSSKYGNVSFCLLPIAIFNKIESIVKPLSSGIDVDGDYLMWLKFPLVDISEGVGFVRFRTLNELILGLKNVKTASLSYISNNDLLENYGNDICYLPYDYLNRVLQYSIENNRYFSEDEIIRYYDNKYINNKDFRKSYCY